MGTQEQNGNDRKVTELEATSIEIIKSDRSRWTPTLPLKTAQDKNHHLDAVSPRGGTWTGQEVTTTRAGESIG